MRFYDVIYQKIGFDNYSDFVRKSGVIRVDAGIQPHDIPSIENDCVGTFTMEAVQGASIEVYEALREELNKSPSISIASLREEEQRIDDLIRSYRAWCRQHNITPRSFDFDIGNQAFGHKMLYGKYNEAASSISIAQEFFTDSSERKGLAISNDIRQLKSKVLHEYDTPKKNQIRGRIQQLEAALEKHNLFRKKYDNGSPEGFYRFISEGRKTPLSTFFSKELRYMVPASARKKHLYCVAQTGTGKSEFLKLLAYFDMFKDKNKSLVLIDPHGSFYDQVARFKEFLEPEYRERLVLIDPKLQKGHTPTLNPFILKNRSTENVSKMAQELLKVLSSLLKGVSQTAQMDAILLPCITVLLRKGNSSLVELQRFMDDENNEDLLELGKNSDIEQHAQLFRSKFSDDSFRATKHGIYMRLQILLNDPVLYNLLCGENTLDFEKIVNNKGIVLFRLSFGDNGTESMQTFGRFIVAMLRIIGLNRNGMNLDALPAIHTYIDEFHNFVSDDIETTLTELRKYKIILHLAHQYVGQTNDPNLQKALFGTGVQVLGNNESSTLKRIENETFLKPQEVRELGTGEFYINTIKTGAARNKPVKIKAAKFLLDHTNSMTNEEYEKLRSENLKKHYRSTKAKQKPSPAGRQKGTDKPKYKL